MLKAFYAFKRGGYWQVKLKDEHGKAMTAKSTRTKDRNEAEAIMWRWYFERQGGYYARQPQYFQVQTTNTPLAVTEADGRKYDKLTAYELMDLFWNYEKSPYILELKRRGRKVPNPERFNGTLGIMKQMKKELSKVKMHTITAQAINDILQNYQAKRNTSNATMKNYAAFFRQAFRYFYKKELITRDISDKIIMYTSDTKTKAILGDYELQKLFSKVEYFPSENICNFIKTLAVTGCRTGEILALQKGDLQHTENGYFLNISKNYTPITKRLKETKTGRRDFVFIPESLATTLQGEMKDTRDFIFSNPKKNEPLQYHKIAYYFKEACKKAGIYKDNLTLHSLRHSFTIMARDKGITAEQLLQVTRHESLAGLKTYLNHVSKAVIMKQREVANYISDFLS